MKAVILFLFVLVFFACNNDDEPAPVSHTGVFYGEEVAVGNGKAASYVVLEDNKPLSVGIRFNKDALTNLPQAHHTSFLLPLPSERGEIPFKHVTLDWESHGHDPEGVYDLPHFDMHFYMITNQERLAIGSDDPKLEVVPDLKYIPEGYFPTPGFPQMGKHWLDGSSPEWHGETFTYTFIYGTYNGNISFYEPMITRDFLLSDPDIEVGIRQPTAFKQNGYFPRKFSIKFDQQAQEYTIALNDFLYRNAE
jgi:hypothetical protein